MNRGSDVDRGRPEPLSRHRFVVEVADLAPIGFAEVHGLSVTVRAQPEDDAAPQEREGENESESDWWDWTDLFDRYAEVGPPTPKRDTTSPNLELRRGVTADLPLYRWLRDWVTGTTEARDVRISLLDERGDPAVGWVCESATPVEWTGPTLTADTASVATETLELAHHGIALVDTE